MRFMKKPGLKYDHLICVELWTLFGLNFHQFRDAIYHADIFGVIFKFLVRTLRTPDWGDVKASESIANYLL